MQLELMRLLYRLDNVRNVGNGYQASCSAHHDRRPSLSIRADDDGKLLVHCFAGCKAVDIVRAVGLELRHLFPDTH